MHLLGKFKFVFWEGVFQPALSGHVGRTEGLIGSQDFAHQRRAFGLSGKKTEGTRVNPNTMSYKESSQLEFIQIEQITLPWPG